MSEEMDCKCCREMTFEEELNSIPIDADLKKSLINRLKQLEEYNIELKDDLIKCHMEIDRMRATIVKLAMMLSD